MPLRTPAWPDALGKAALKEAGGDLLWHARRAALAGGADCTVRLWDAAKAAPAAQPASGAAGGAAAAAAAAGAAGATAPAAGGATGAAGPAGGGGGGGKAGEGLPLLRTLRTKATPVFGLRFTTRNLLLGSGTLSLYRPPKLRA